MLEKFLKQTSFVSQEDFVENFRINVPENFNFAYDVIDEWARTHPQKRALCWVNDHGKHIDFTFADLKRESDRTASFFKSCGIGHGDKVMLILKRRYEFWFAILALHKLGAVCIPATHLLTKKDIVYRCNAASIKAIVCVGDALVTERVSVSKPDCETLETLISTGPMVPEGFKDFHTGTEHAPEFVRPEFVRPEFVNRNDDISLLYFTSGTTGNPKMVAHDYTYPLGHIVTGAYWHNLNEESLHLTVADTGWGKAVWGKLYGQWFAGATVFVYDHEKFTPADMLQVIQDYRITSFCAPPTVFRFMLHEDMSKYDLSSLKWCTIAGEALNPSVYEDFYKITGIKLREGFGQTETTCSILTTPWMEPKPGSMGKPNPAYNVDLVDENGNSVPAGQQGEIVIRCEPENRPAGLFKGYFRDRNLTAKVYHDGLYHTGDVATRDEDGYFWFIGRNDDVIKSSGYRIGPFEVESAVMSYDGVVECAITGVPDAIRGQVVKATIVLSKTFKEAVKDFEDLKKKIQDHVKRETAPYKYPRVIEFVEELPKTISGKIRRVEIRDQMKKLSEAVAPVVDKTKDMTKKLSEMFPKNKKNASVDDEKAPQAS
ncbi:MAG: AMP-binding protein [Opitutales bacterium]|nr:AMP-binding protein [Opitutales bacterium]